MTLSAWKVNVNIFIGFRSLKCHIILVGHFYGAGQLKSLRMITFPPSTTIFGGMESSGPSTYLPDDSLEVATSL